MDAIDTMAPHPATTSVRLIRCAIHTRPAPLAESGEGLNQLCWPGNRATAKPISVAAVWQLVQRYAQQPGLDHIKPYWWATRTLSPSLPTMISQNSKLG
jgi:hypothetical protein